jgi:hypothetical protein
MPQAAGGVEALHTLVSESNGSGVGRSRASSRNRERDTMALLLQPAQHTQRGIHVQMRLLAILLCLAACDDTVPAGKPVGTTVDTDAQLQRFLRRAHLDLTGAVPTDAELAAGTTRLRDAGNPPSARAALADELIAGDKFAAVWIEELESSIFGGNTLEQQYAFVCSVVRGTNQACSSCALADSCACQCLNLPTLFEERTGLRTTAADLRGGMKTSSIEKRYAKAIGYFALAGSPEGRVRSLFDDFLSRPAEPDEIENGRAMIIGAIFPNAPAGLMFHRHGSNYADMLNIVFGSEVYREAIVRRVFERYLARAPRPDELAQFVTTLDATDPDARGLMRAVVSSREYFDQ